VCPSAQRSLQGEYEQRRDRLLQNGCLGHGVQEDLLLRSAAWFHRPLAPEGGSFADFFGTALQHHVAVIAAVDPMADDAARAHDLHAFLQVVLASICRLPAPLLKKSPEPLTLIIAAAGSGYAFGAHILEPRGPSLIYWEVFRELRHSLVLGDYQPLAGQIQRTLVHELLGHQLAFCSSAGPLVPREDLRDILAAAGIRYLKLVDSPSIEVDLFLQADDLLAAVRRIHYLVSRRNAEKYFVHLTELIAFSLDASPPTSALPYGEILQILKRNFLRSPNPVNVPGNGQLPLYEGYDPSGPECRRYYTENTGTAWRETPALCRQGMWLTLAGLIDGWYARRRELSSTPQQWIEPNRLLFLRIPFGGYLVELDQQAFLACPFGLFAEDAGQVVPCADEFPERPFAIESHRRGGDTCDEFRVSNRSARPLPFRLLELDAASASVP
jgi:hypothetical protein